MDNTQVRMTNLFLQLGLDSSAEAIAVSAITGDFRGKVLRAMFLGSIAEYLVEVPGSEPWLVDHANPGDAGLFAVDQEVFLTPHRPSVHVLA